MPHSNPVVQTTTGPVRGRVASDGEGLLCFLGIPYAAPPTGSRRFMPPEPAAPWVEVRDAFEFGPAAAQVYDPLEAALDEFGAVPRADGSPPDWVGDEDCLTLNVWTPAADAGRRPVLVWVHGGANWLEGSRLGCYDGAALARRGDTVVVSLNYRLGIFGFLDLSVLGGEPYRGSHCNGLRDQLLALQWIRDNVAGFGGDPSNITLAGESAGAMNISWLATTGLLHGLVRRLVLMSGVASVVGFGHDHRRSAHGEEEGQERARRFLAELALDDMGTLLALPTGEILGRHAALARRCNILFDLDTLFYPRVDARFTRSSPFDAAAAGLYDGFELMIGFTAYEMGLWLQWDPDLDQQDTHTMAARLPNFPPACRGPVAAFYEGLYAAESGGMRAMRMLADACFVMPSVLLAERVAARGGAVWMYQFDWQAADPRRGAQHAADQGFFFGTLDSAGARLISGTPRDARDAQDRQALSHAMQDALLRFVRGGDPVHAAEVAWPRYTGARAVMHLDAPTSAVRYDGFAPRRRWWQQNVYGPADAGAGS